VSGDASSPKARDPRMVAVIVASALLMQNLDASVVATALPSMARDLGVDPVHLSVAITSYLVTLCVFIPVSGWIADRFGARRVFMAAIVVFTVASAFVGLSQGIGTLVAARVLQGIGGAMMVPVGRLLLLRRVRKEELITAMTWLTMPGLLGPVFGPPVGGLLTDAISWRAVFWINIPIGCLGLLLVWRFIPDVERQDPGPFDGRGLTLWGTALFLMMAGLETIGRPIAPVCFAPVAFGLGVAATLAAIRHSRRVARPAVDLSLLKLPSFGITISGSMLYRIGAATLPFLLPLKLQLVFGLSAGASGMITFATAIGAFVMKPLVRPTLKRHGFRATLAVNCILAALLVAACALFTPSWPVLAIFAVLAVGGVTRSLQFTALNTLSYADVPNEKLAPATAMSGVVQQLGQALGVVVGSLLLEGAQFFTGSHAPGQMEFSLAFLASGVIILGSMPAILSLPRDVGAGVSGHRR
jgi:EmrB/QacA subfamily drug resistance transporter